MPVPVKMSDLLLTAASDSPQGTDTIGTSLSAYLRALASIVRSTQSTSTASVASASTTDVSASDGLIVNITGTATINGLGVGFVGCYRELQFTTALTITHSTSLWLGGTNITTASGDVFGFRCTGASIWTLATSNRISASFASAALTGTSTVNGVEIGFRGVPQTVSNAAYTFASTDKGMCRVKNDGSAYTYTVPAVFVAGDVVTVLNVGSAGAVTLAGSGVTLQLAGTATTGNRTVALGGLATIYFDSATHAVVSGAGVS